MYSYVFNFLSPCTQNFPKRRRNSDSNFSFFLLNNILYLLALLFSLSVLFYKNNDTRISCLKMPQNALNFKNNPLFQKSQFTIRTLKLPNEKYFSFRTPQEILKHSYPSSFTLYLPALSPCSLSLQCRCFPS